MPPKKKTKKNGSGMTAFHAAAVAAAAPADSSAAPVDAAAPPPIEPYFGAHGEATIVWRRSRSGTWIGFAWVYYPFPRYIKLVILFFEYYSSPYSFKSSS